jgi:hypothetical protein
VGVIFGLRPKITPTSITHPSDSRKTKKLSVDQELRYNSYRNDKM